MPANPSVVEGQAFKGRKITFTWKGETILGIRERSIKLAGNPVDVTSDDDDGWRRLADENGAAQDDVDFTCTGVTKSTSLKEDWFARERTGTLEITFPTGHKISGTAVLTSYTDTGPYNNAATFEAQFQFSGPVTFDYTLS